MKPEKKVLVVPSWSPTPGHLSRGVFFEEQAALATQEFDVRMLIVDSTRVSRRRPLEWTRYAMPAPPAIMTTEHVGKSRLAVHRLPLRIASMSEKQHFAAWSRGLCRAFEQFCRAGWTPDLLHAQCAIDAGVTAREIRRAFGIPYVVTEHQHIIFEYFSHEQWEAAKRIYGEAERVAVVSEFEKLMLLMNGVTKLPSVVGNFVDESMFTMKAPRSPATSFTLLFIGTTSRLKDRLTFFRALESLRSAPGLTFNAHMVAPPMAPGDTERLKQDLDQFGLVSSVVVHTSASREQIVKLIHAADVLVSTSLAETFGVAVCEALMCGCPVVVTQSGGIADFVRDGANGFIVPVGDWKSVARRIRYIAAGTLSLDAAAIRQSVLGSYGQHGFLAKLKELYA